MKKVVGVLLIVCLLSGCVDADRELKQGMALRTKLLAARECGFDVDITADYGDKVYTFSMTCLGDPEGNISFAVTQPETIAGITGNVSEEGGTLTFDDTALCFELMADDQLSPVSAPWIFLKTLRSGYLTSACMEEDLLRLSIDDSFDDDALHLDIWVETDTPVRAEILYDNRRILTLEVKNFVIR